MSEEKDQSLLTEEASGCGQCEEGRQAFRQAEEGEGNPLSLICAGIASQPLVP